MKTKAEQRAYNRQKQADWRAKHPERVTSQNRRFKAKLPVGQNPSGEQPEGPCEICGDVCRLVWDHDHATGAFRGWLCGHCNRAIGLMKDDPLRLLNAVDYLTRTKR